MDIILQLIKKEELNHNYDISLFRVCHSLPPLTSWPLANRSFANHHDGGLPCFFSRGMHSRSKTR